MGAFAASRIDRRLTLRLVSVLCMLQFAATLGRELPQVGAAGLLLAAAALCLFNVLFAWMWRLGESRAEPRERGSARPPPS